VLPPSKTQLVEERVEVPGFPAETRAEYYAIVRPYKGRTAVLLKPMIEMPEAEAMSRLGLDPTKPIEIRLQYGRNWIKAHKRRGMFYTRVWIPQDEVRRTGIRDYQVYPVYIRGMTLPTVEIRYVYRDVREVLISHMGKVYNTENYAPNKWRWRIPRQIESFPVLVKAMTLNIYPEAECHLSNLKDIIFVDFAFNSASGRVVSEAMNYCYRNMAVRNYSATHSETLDYPYLAEIRCFYITSTPKAFYQPDEKHQTELKKALEITVYNMVEYFFPKVKEEYNYSIMSWADHIDAIDFVTHRVEVHSKYPQLKIEKPWQEKYLRYISDGDGLPSEETLDTTKKFYYCNKYIRILNESSYTAHDLDRWVYTNEKIEAIIRGKQHDRIMEGYSAEVTIDANGFLWQL